jgi:predicted dehydrogenase
MNSSRRSFIKSASLGTLAAAFPAITRSASPNSHFQVATVGADGMAFSDLKQIGTHPKVKFVGFCDVDSNRFVKADAAFPNVPHFVDYREMLASLGDKVDGVSVSIPDHMHAHASIEAMKRGKHVYCQKPLAHTVWEARQMSLYASSTRVVTQMGNQIHSNLEYRLGTRLIREGFIGKVKEVHSWASVTGNERNKLLTPPSESLKVPTNLNWDLWIGVAAMREYKSVYHPFVWRDWQDFGSGALGDFGCHILDPVFTALDLHAPSSLSAENSGINDHIWPTLETVKFLFPANKLTSGALPVTWYDGGLKPSKKLAKMPLGDELPSSGSLFIGEEGTLILPHVGMPKLYPVEKFATRPLPEETKLSHWHVWVDAAMSGAKTSDGFHYAGPLSETVALGNIATRFPKRSLEWDTKALRFTNLEDANRYITKSYRKGWEIAPAPSA